MAVSPSALSNTLLIEISGVAAGPLDTVLPPNYRVARIAAAGGASKALWAGGTVSLGEMAADFNLAQPGPLLDWLAALAAGKPQPVDGAVQVLDANFTEKRRIAFFEGELTEVALPLLSATAAKRPFTIGLKWLPSRVEDGAGSGKASRPAVGKRKAIMTSNFRVLGLPFDGSFITEVGLPTLSAQLEPGNGRTRQPHDARVDNGELRLGFARRSTTEVLAWVAKLATDGRVEADEAMTITVEMLDATLKTVLATVQLHGCTLLACDEARIEARADTAGTGVSLRFAVARVGLQVKE